MKVTRADKWGTRPLSLLMTLALVAASLALLPAQKAAAELPTEITAAQEVPDAIPPLLQRDEDVVTADPIPTVQIDDGYVWSQATIGTTVYAVGKFDNARAPLAPPGTALTARSNVLAYDIVTGELLPFAPTVNGEVRAVVASPAGDRIYIGGSFTSVNGQSRHSFAALDATTGELVPGFTPAVGGSGVYALAVSGSTIYAGGRFTQANGTPRKNLAAFNATNGALRPWAPETDRQVDAMVLDPVGQKIIAGGRFSQTNGNTAMRGAVALDKETGEVDADWALVQTVKNGWGTGSSAGRAGIWALATDDSGVYGTGWVFASATVGNLEGTFAAEADTGEVRWIADCLGDHYGVYSTGKIVYTSAHTHACSTVGLHPEQSPRTHRFVEAYTVDAKGRLGRNPHAGGTYQNWEGTPGPSAYYWIPDFVTGTKSGLNQAGLSITGVGNTISVAGEFPAVNNLQFEGIVRFSTTPPGGANQGPRFTGSSWVPNAVSVVPGRVRVTIPTNHDRDDLDLTYELRRSGVSTPIATVTAESRWWSPQGVLLEDTNATPGATHSYTVVARDSDGNTGTSQSVSVVVADGEAASYVAAVLDDSPSLYYPLGNSQLDWAGTNTPVFRNGVSSAPQGGIQNSATGHSNFNGGTNNHVNSSSRVSVPAEYSTELWFRTNTTRGGKLIGYGDSATGSSSSYDRHVYMRNDGRLVFGVYPGETKTVTSPSSYRDNQWHHLVATQSANGIALYVDGELVASDSGVSSAQDYLGFWRVGGDNTNGWPSPPSSNYFSGSIDEVAVYPYALSPAQISTHYGVGIGHEAPTATFTATVEGLDVEFDGNASTAQSGANLVEYIWDFGDGSAAGSGAEIEHSYESSGTYSVSLTVVDSHGLVGVHEQDVTVLGPNVNPEAIFTASVSGLAVTTDASESSDPDGTIVSYEWDWGDESSPSEGQVVSHTYAAPGTYTVTLTVTDDRDGVASATEEVEVVHADPIAHLTSSISGLTVSVDGSESVAFNDATLEYEWNWGDSTANSAGATTSHTYAEDGEYEITLTVTDSFGSTHSASQQISVTAEALAASDTFSRVVSNGWGAAEVGGTWAPRSGSANVASVSEGVGRLDLAPGATREMVLQGNSALDSLTNVAYTLNGGPDTGVAYVGIGSRYTSERSYRSQVWHRADGTMWLLIERNGVALASKPLTEVSWSAGSTFHLAAETSGTSPTVIKAKVWAEGTSEPGWQVEATDSTAALQEPGTVSIRHYRAGTATGSNTIEFDNFTLRDLSESGGNAPPVASFTSSVSGLSVEVDGSASSDADGAIESYEWDFGGEATASGVTASHEFAEAGTYTVTLTVTDGEGATHSVSEQVTVGEGSDEDPLILDEFGRTVSSGWGSADSGGEWSVTGGAAAAASVSDGRARLGLAPASTRTAVLSSPVVGSNLAEVEFSVDQDPESGATYVGVTPRRVGNDYYLVHAWLRVDGRVWLVAQRNSVVLASTSVSGLNYGSGDQFRLKVETSGTGGETQLRGKIWKVAEAEPANWQLTAIDDWETLQADGTVGVRVNRAGSSTSRVEVAFDRFAVELLE